ncbi:hypothetical protein OKW43_000415 [Paraburkholderia sp. WC7.3g]
MNRDRNFRCDPASWTKGSHSLIEARATPAVSRAPIIWRALGVRSLMGLLDALQLGEALCLPFLHAGLFPHSRMRS